jgi:hypothetical protein
MDALRFLRKIVRSVMSKVVLTVCALLLACSACSGTTTPPDAERSGNSSGTGGNVQPITDGAAPGPAFPSEALSSFKTPDDAFRVELRTLPAQPIHVGPDNQGELRFFDATSGEPVDGLVVKVTTWMPVMKHKCSEAPVHVKPQGNGVYLLTPLVASMPGKCELQLSVTAPLADGGRGPSMSVVSPTFDVEQ